MGEVIFAFKRLILLLGPHLVSLKNFYPKTKPSLKLFIKFPVHDHCATLHYKGWNVTRYERKHSGRDIEKGTLPFPPYLPQ